MERIENSVSGTVPQAIRLGVGSIPNEGARYGTVAYLWVVSRDECKGTTANFTEMGQRGLMVIPKFVRCLTVICRCAGEVGKIGGGGTKLIPHGEGRSTRRAHGACFVHKSAVEPFSTAVMGRRVRSSE
jgi:hypothetical protein